jgi:Ca-activated chloride channel family protein
MLLRDSKYKGNASWDTALNLATNSIGEDEDGYRGEFIGLIRKAMNLLD